MAGYNPMTDLAVIAGFMVLLLVIGYIGDKHDKRKKAALRGATRIITQ
jgi:hypothetical protein